MNSLRTTKNPKAVLDQNTSKLKSIDTSIIVKLIDNQREVFTNLFKVYLETFRVKLRDPHSFD